MQVYWLVFKNSTKGIARGFLLAIGAIILAGCGLAKTSSVLLLVTGGVCFSLGALIVLIMPAGRPVYGKEAETSIVRGGRQEGSGMSGGGFD